MFSLNSDLSVLIILATRITIGLESQKEEEGGRTILQEINNQAENKFICTFFHSSQKQQTALAIALKALTLTCQWL